MYIICIKNIYLKSYSCLFVMIIINYLKPYNYLQKMVIKSKLLLNWLFIWVCYAKSIFIQKSVLFQTIQFSMSTHFNCQKHFYFKLFSLFRQFLFS